MADITSPAVIEFVTKYARPLATELEALYFKCMIAHREWVVDGVASACQTPTDNIVDGNVKPITAYDVGAFVDDVQALVTEMDATGQAKISRAAKVAGHLSMFDAQNKA